MPSLLSPRYWGVHLLALVCTLAAVALGLWQYDAWQARRSAEAVDLTRLDPVPLDRLIGPDDPFPGTEVGHPVTVTGQWVPGGTVYVSDRPHGDRTGYWAVTPLAVGGPDAAAVPVVRGWVADPDQAPRAPRGHAELVGWLQPPEGTGDVDPDPHDDVLPQLRIADVIQHVDQDLYGAYVVAAAPEDLAGGSSTTSDASGSATSTVNDGRQGLERADLEELPDAGRFTALRNLLYAIEWWIFAAFAVFVWWRWTQDVRRGEDQAEEAEPDPVASGT